MFAIRSIDLVSFKSFKGRHSFSFPIKPGLYFLTGDNQAEPKLGSNGAGKSTLLDAIYWCLFGKSLRGLKAGDIITWGEASCAVTLLLVIHGEDQIITRKQSPNGLELNGRPVSQEALEKQIGLNPKSFVYSVILPQFGQSFFELGPAEKLALFSDIMGLDLWLDKSQQALEAARGLENKIAKVSLAAHDAGAALTATKGDLKDFLDKEHSFRATLQQSLSRLQNEYDNLLNRQAKHAKTGKALDKEMKRLLYQKSTNKANVEHFNNCKLEYMESGESIRVEQALLTSTLKGLQARIDATSNVSSICPTCRQPISRKGSHESKQRLAAELGQQRLKLGDLNSDLAENKKSIALMELKAGEARRGLITTEMAFTDVNSSLIILAERIKVGKTKSSELQREIEIKEADTNPFTAMVAERQNKIHEIGVSLGKYNTQLRELTIQHTATEYWITGFKRIRLFIIEETLHQLEIEVNNSLASLGLVDWRIGFDVERENKTGGITKGFVVFVHCPSNPEPVRWESWSGGETQRLQLAGDFGLANLIMLQAGLANTIEFYDEPSEHLSTEGLNDLAETLYERAVNDGKSIFLVDHRIPDFGDFEGVIKVTKTADGSSIAA